MDSNSILSVSLVLYIIASVSFPAYYAQGPTNSDSPCPYGYFYNNTRTTVSVHPTTTESSTAGHANDSTTLGMSQPSFHPSEGTTIDPGCYPCESHMLNCTGCHYSDGYFNCTNCSNLGEPTSYGSCTPDSTTSATSTPSPQPFPVWAIIVIVVGSASIIIIVIIVAVVCIRRNKNSALPLMPDFSVQSQKIPTGGPEADKQRYVRDPGKTSLERIESVHYGNLKMQNADNPVYDDRIDDPSSAINGDDDASRIYGNDDVIQKHHRNFKEPDVTVDEIYTNEDPGGESTEELYLNNEDARREVGLGIDNTTYDGGYMNKEEFDRARKQAELAREAAAKSAAKSAQKSRPINTGPSDLGANADNKKKKPKNNRNLVEHRPRVNEPTVQGARDSMFPPGQNGGDELYGNQEEFAKPRTPAVKEDYGQIYANT